MEEVWSILLKCFANKERQVERGVDAKVFTLNTQKTLSLTRTQWPLEIRPMPTGSLLGPPLCDSDGQT